jgi:polyferredoxin
MAGQTHSKNLKMLRIFSQICFLGQISLFFCKKACKTRSNCLKSKKISPSAKEQALHTVKIQVTAISLEVTIVIFRCINFCDPYCTRGFSCKELIEESPLTFIADRLSVFSARSRFCDL